MARAKSRPDFNEVAFSVVAQATGTVSKKKTKKKRAKKKDPAAVALGRKGGLKGGKARAAKLTYEQRRDIALKGAKTRWKWVAN